jgi:hypothetical protein
MFIYENQYFMYTYIYIIHACTPPVSESGVLLDGGKQAVSEANSQRSH